MRIGLYGKPTENNLSEYVIQLISALRSYNVELSIFSPFYEFLKDKLDFTLEITAFNKYEDIKGKIDFLFSIGGDGTLLNTITLIRDSSIPVIGINTGGLGFLSSISKQEFKQTIEKLIKGEYEIDSRTLLKVDTKSGLFGEDNFSLNEFTVQKYETPTMIHIYAYVNNDFLNSYWADGLIISTPTGSTGYSLSCGGPIITPDSQNFVITPIATHNLTVRPIIIPDNYIITLKVKSVTQKMLICLDSRSEIVDSSIELVISKQDFRINLVRIPGIDFFSTIRNKLMWGLDIRND